MIIWTGWGILAPVIIFGGMFGIESLLEPSLVEPWPTVIGAIIAAAALWLFGRWINVQRPRARAERIMPAREAELRQAVETGNYAPGGIRPTSLAEARVLAEEQLVRERKDLVDSGHRHTFFFLPMHWWAVVVLGAGLWQGIGALFH